MSEKLSTYRIWIAVPVEVKAYDEINAEETAKSVMDVCYSKPMTDAERRRFKRLQHPISAKTEIRVKGEWEPI